LRKFCKKKPNGKGSFKAALTFYKYNCSARNGVRKYKMISCSNIIRHIFFIAIAVLLSTLMLKNSAKTKEGATNSYTAQSKRLPRFVSLRAGEVRLRTGPGVRYPVDWVYHRKFMPVEVLQEFGTWRKVRDVQGSQGWVHQSLLHARRTFIIIGQTRTLRKNQSSKSAPIARIEINVVGRLEKCPDTSGWCKVSVYGYEGWLRRVEFWGIYPSEAIN